MYRFGGQQLNIHGPGLEPAPVARLPVQPGGSDLCFLWSEPIEGAIDHLRAHSVEVELGPVRRQGARGEGTSVYFRDPDGSLLEFISYAWSRFTSKSGRQTYARIAVDGVSGFVRVCLAASCVRVRARRVRIGVQKILGTGARDAPWTIE